MAIDSEATDGAIARLPVSDVSVVGRHEAAGDERLRRALLALTAEPAFGFEFDPPIATSRPADEQLSGLRNGTLVDCNEACARALGGSREELIGRRLAEVLPIDADESTDLLRSFIASEYRIVDAGASGTASDGNRRRFVVSATGIAAEGRLSSLWGTWRDVSPRQDAEARVRQSELRLNEAQRLAKIGSWEVDPASATFTWSDEVFRIFEADPDRFVPSYESFMARVHPDDRPRVDAAYDESVTTGAPYEIEHRIVLDNGSIKHVSERCEMFFDESGRLLRSIGTIQDISERKRAEATIEELMARLEALASVAFDGIAISADGVLLECSAQLASALGYTAAEVVGKPILGFVAPAFRQSARNILSGDTVKPFELRMLRHDGSTLPVEVVRATITGGDRRLRIYGLRDISHRKELQNEVIAVSEDERHRIGRDLHDGVGQLLFGASLSLRSVCDELEQSDSALLPTVQRIKDIIVDAIDETRRVSHLLVPMIYDRRNLSGSLTKLVATVNEVSTIRFRVECDYDRALPTNGTAEQLYRITQECISNVLKHSAASEVRVRLFAEGDLLHLEVIDDGIGISPERAGDAAGLGVRSMHYRAGLIDGSLAIVPGEAGGTRVICTCPL